MTRPSRGSCEATRANWRLWSSKRGLLGEALNHAARRATGSFIAKMDDDDWYGRDHLADLALSVQYSGAELVGCRSEFIYIQQLDRTVRRGHTAAVEIPSSMSDTGIIAGGTILVNRSLFEAIGGFKLVPTFEDGELCSGVRAAGGQAYRTHGLNYVYRRREAQAHTWQISNDHFLQGDPPQWPGLYLNSLMR